MCNTRVWNDLWMLMSHVFPAAAWGHRPLCEHSQGRLDGVLAKAWELRAQLGIVHYIRVVYPQNIPPNVRAQLLPRGEVQG